MFLTVKIFCKKKHLYQIIVKGVLLKENLGYVILIFIFMCVDVFPACKSMYHICIFHRDQKRASDLLELELETVLSHHVDAGNQTQDPPQKHHCS